MPFASSSCCFPVSIPLGLPVQSRIGSISSPSLDVRNSFVQADFGFLASLLPLGYPLVFLLGLCSDQGLFSFRLIFLPAPAADFSLAFPSCRGQQVSRPPFFFPPFPGNTFSVMAPPFTLRKVYRPVQSFFALVFLFGSPPFSLSSLVEQAYCRLSDDRTTFSFPSPGPKPPMEPL